jgi:hypothetical protein
VDDNLESVKVEIRLRDAADYWNQQFAPLRSIDELMRERTLDERTVRRQRVRGWPVNSIARVAAMSGVVLSLIGAVAWYSGLLSGRSPSPSQSSSRGPITCGEVPHSSIRGYRMHIRGPASGVTGSRIRVQVGVDSTAATKVLDIQAPADILIVSEGKVVGRYSGAVGGTGLELRTRQRDQLIPSDSVLLSGCSRGTLNSARPDSSREPLPPATYGLVAVIYSEARTPVLVSPAFAIRVVEH